MAAYEMLTKNSFNVTRVQERSRGSTNPILKKSRAESDTGAVQPMGRRTERDR
jgi:hypothetical protein